MTAPFDEDEILNTKPGNGNQKHAVLYHEQIRNMTIAFGTLFREIYVQRINKHGYVYDIDRVGLTYANKQKYFRRNQEDERVAIKLPIMAFSIDAMNYAPDRSVSRKRTDSNGNKPPTPWDIVFNLSLLSNTQTEAFQIVEQILATFDPEYMMNIRTFDGAESYNVPITLLSVLKEDSYDGSFDDTRRIIWNFSFLMKSWFFTPTPKGGDGSSGNRIEQVILGLQSGAADSLTIRYEPYIEGVPVSEIDKNDDYELRKTIDEGMASDE